MLLVNWQRIWFLFYLSLLLLLFAINIVEKAINLLMDIVCTFHLVFILFFLLLFYKPFLFLHPFYIFLVKVFSWLASHVCKPTIRANLRVERTAILFYLIKHHFFVPCFLLLFLLPFFVSFHNVLLRPFIKV